MDPTLLASLLGATGQTLPAPSPTAAPSPLQPQAPIAPQAAPPPSQQPPITVTGQGDPWRPHKRSLLGTIADFALAAIGVPLFPFGKHNENQNVHEAMANYMANPRQAIHRLSEIGGHEFEAQKLASDEDDSDMKAANYARMNDVYKLAADRQYLGMAASMMNSVKDKSPDTIGAMRDQVLNLLHSRNVDVPDGLIPEDGNMDALNAFISGAVPVAKQEQMQETANKDANTSDYRNRSLAERSAFHQGELRQGQARVGVSQGNLNERVSDDQVTHQQNQERIDKMPDKTPAKGSFSYTMKNGYQLTVEPQADGSYVAHGPDGAAYRYVRVGNNLVPTHQIAAPKKQ